MSRTLILIRHAKSDWSVSGQKDFDRDLNSRGYSDAPRIGKRLSSLGVQPQLIISSPAKRAKLTAELVTEQINFDSNKIVFNEDVYEASLRTLLSLVNNLDNKYTEVAIFGHNPGFTWFAEYLTKDEINNIPTCGAISIRIDVDSWEEVSGGLGYTNWFIYPKLYK
ncbi:histidine phosphatase family protein [Cytophagaceae bacterium ABcell3]|nr:histidine phosphatase family protein [Cytophagaceae bacterium ABcell3]